MDKNTMDCWNALANAVILQAIDDYRAACRKLRRRPSLRQTATQKRSLERFFSSAWFRTLTAVDGKELLETLRREADR